MLQNVTIEARSKIEVKHTIQINIFLFQSESYTHYLELLSLPTPVAQLLPATAKEEETNILHGVWNFRDCSSTILLQQIMYNFFRC